MNIELLMLVISLLFFVSIVVSKAGNRLGVPALLLFLCVGMAFGSDGLGIHFDNIETAQTIGTVALCIILFSGGMDTKIEDVKPVIAPGLALATVGVLLTSLSTGLIIWLIMHKTVVGASMGLMSAILLASTMSSTDSASVFSILRSKGLKLKHNLRPILELESGSNDPMAYVLTVTFIQLVLHPSNPQYGMAVLTVVMQLVIGALAGILIGKLVVLIVNRINVDNASLYPIIVLSACVFLFSATGYLHGNSYLAVYLGGLMVGNNKFVHKRSTRNFFDGLSWLCQLSMFLTLGLLVNPTELKDVLVPGLAISFLMIFVTRPFSVFVTLLPFRKLTFLDKTYISWVGLRGAVPIIFAILCRAAEVPHSHEIFNIVFICTLISLVLQGTTISFMAEKVKLLDEPDQNKPLTDFDFEFSEDVKSATTEFEVTKEILSHGERLMDLGMPENTLVIMVKREEQFFVPTGKTVLLPKDKLLVISDNNDEMELTLQKLGVKIPSDKANTATGRKQEFFSSELLNIIEKITVEESRVGNTENRTSNPEDHI